MANGIHAKTPLSVKRAGLCALAAMMVCGLSLPSLAFAAVKVDDTELAQGGNAVGGGTATLADSSLDMQGVTANVLYTDNNLVVNFNGGNALESMIVAGSAEAQVNFAGENEVEDLVAQDNANLTINANGNNEFEGIFGSDNANVTVNVTGENDIDFIGATKNASITVRGTDCQRKDVVNLGEDEPSTGLTAANGDVTIDHVTLNVKGKIAWIGSDNGNVRIDTSKVAQDDGNEYVSIAAGGTMEIAESVVDITGTVHAAGQMTISHSDVKVKRPESKFGDTNPYRVSSDAGIRLIDQKNGVVEQGTRDGKKVWYVDTDDNDGKIVDLKADGEPAYYRCTDRVPAAPKSMTPTGDAADPFLPMAAGLASVTTAAYALRRREQQQDQE